MSLHKAPICHSFSVFIFIDRYHPYWFIDCSSLPIMTGDRISNCDIVLRGMTTLRNHRPLPDKPLTYVYDGLFSCAEQLDKDGVGVFQHFIGKDASLKRDGTYEITAVVIITSHSSYNFFSQTYRLHLIEPAITQPVTNLLTKPSILWGTSIL